LFELFQKTTPSEKMTINCYGGGSGSEHIFFKSLFSEMNGSFVSSVKYIDYANWQYFPDYVADECRHGLSWEYMNADLFTLENPTAHIYTFFYILNELYAQGREKIENWLKNLFAYMEPGTTVLICDAYSPLNHETYASNIKSILDIAFHNNMTTLGFNFSHKCKNSSLSSHVEKSSKFPTEKSKMRRALMF
jgi:hypothetical protein